MLPMHRAAFAATLLLALAACGGSGGGSSSLTGTFVDSPVVGLYYAASPSGLNGKTDSAGHFNYQSGDKVNFVLGGGGDKTKGASFGSATPGPNGRVSPKTLGPDGATANADFPVNVAQMLQSLSSTDPTQTIKLPPDEDARLNSINQVTFNTDNTSFQASANNNGITLSVSKQQAQQNLDNGTTVLDFLNTTWTDSFPSSSCPNGTSTVTVTFTKDGTAFSNQQTCAGSDAPSGTFPYEPSCLPSSCVASDLSGKTYQGDRYDLTVSNPNDAPNSDGNLVPKGTLKITHADNTADTLTR